MSYFSFVMDYCEHVNNYWTVLWKITTQIWNIIVQQWTITVQQWPNYSAIQWEETIPPILPNSGRPRRLRTAHLEDRAAWELCNCPSFPGKEGNGPYICKIIVIQKPAKRHTNLRFCNIQNYQNLQKLIFSSFLIHALFRVNY